MVINPSSVTGKNLGTVLKKICERYAGWKGNPPNWHYMSVWIQHSYSAVTILAENNLSLEVIISEIYDSSWSSPGKSTCSTPSTSRKRSRGAPGVLLWSCSCRTANHYRLAMGGSALLEAKPVLSSLFPDGWLDGFLMVYQFWCKDVVIRRNMTMGRWMDCLTLITSNTVGITDLDGNAIDDEELKRLLSKELLQHRAAIRHAVVIGPDQRMALEIQAMPASEAVLTSKPAFVG